MGSAYFLPSLNASSPLAPTARRYAIEYREMWRTGTGKGKLSQQFLLQNFEKK